MGILYPQVKSESIPAGHLPLSKLLFECGMDKFEIRRLNLQALLRTHCQGKAAALADKIGRSPSYISRMLYPEGKTGKKRIGEDMRNLIEDTLALARGTLDDEATALAENGNSKAVVETADSAPLSSPTSRHLTDVALGEVTIERFDAGEKKLIELYRRASKDGKMIILGAATVAPKGGELTASSSTETTLGYIDASEKRILEFYRQADNEGKMIILGAATVAPKDEKSDAVGHTD
jgi:hypothetical protein